MILLNHKLNMKNKIIPFVASSAALAMMLVAGVASAHTLSLGGGLTLGGNDNHGSDVKAVATVNAEAKAHHYDNDNDGDDNWMGHATSTHATTSKPALFTGNGQPVVGGTVTAVNGNTLTVLTATGVTYTVNATSSTVVRGNATTTASNLAVGTKVLVQGSVNGSVVTATSVIATNATTTANTSDGHKGFGFGGWIRGFFHNLFGFF